MASYWTRASSSYKNLCPNRNTNSLGRWLTCLYSYGSYRCSYVYLCYRLNPYSSWTFILRSISRRNSCIYASRACNQYSNHRAGKKRTRKPCPHCLSKQRSYNWICIWLSNQLFGRQMGHKLYTAGKTGASHGKPANSKCLRHNTWLPYSLPPRQ